ncbi:hypothetical protein V8D89_014667 [Ganoderma adspersum]
MTVSQAPSTSSSSWFVNALATQQEEPVSEESTRTGQSAARASDPSGGTTSHHGLPARPAPIVIGMAEQLKPSKAPRPSSASPSLATSSSTVLRPTSSTTPNRSPVLPPSTGMSPARLSHAASISPASINESLPQDDADMDDPLRQAISRFDAEVAEVARIQAETRRIVANFQDTGAHVHARAEGLAEQFRSRYANTERRIARANQRADELERKLHESHNMIAHLEGGNKDLRRELDQLRGERDRLRGERDRLRAELDRLRGELDSAHGELDQTHGELERVRTEAGKDDARLNEVLKSCQDAIKETELARARWAVVQKKLEDQLAAQKRGAVADKEALLAQIEELRRAAEDAKRQVSVLVEEKLKLEVQIQNEVAQRKRSVRSPRSGYPQPNQPLSTAGGETVKTVDGNEQIHNSARNPADLPVAQLQQSSHAPCTAGSALPAPLSPPSTVSTLSHSPASHHPPSARPTSSGDGTTQRRSRGKLLHLTDESPASPRIAPPSEPLLAVKDEEQDGVKAKVEPSDETPAAFPFASDARLPLREQRREQSLDYAPIQQEPPQSPLMQQAVADTTMLPSSAAPYNEEYIPGSPVVSLGRHSPELAYPSRHSSCEPIQPPREPSPIPYAQGPSGRPLALGQPQTQRSSDHQLIGERRGPMTPPLETAPSAQPKRLIRRPPPYSQAIDSTVLPARPVQPPAQRSSSPSARRGSDSWRPSREHEPRGAPVRYSNDSRDRHKRRRDDDADPRQPAPRRPRLTPTRGPDHCALAPDYYPPPASRQTSQDFTHRTPPRQLNDDRSHYHAPPPQDYQHRDSISANDEHPYVPVPNENLRRLADHYSPPSSPQQRTRYSPDVPTTGYAPAREARAAPIPDTEPPHPQVALSLAQRIQGNPDAPVHEQPRPSSGPTKPVPDPRPPRTNGGPAPARRQAKRQASRSLSPSQKRPPPSASAKEPILSVSVSVPLLERFSDSKPQAPASRGRGSGRGRGRGRGGQQQQPQQRPPVDRPQRTLEERLSTKQKPESGGGGDLMNRIQPR